MSTTSDKKGKEYLLLKWGVIKGWEDLTERSVAILERYYKDGRPMSCMADRPDDERKQILCELIDQLDGSIWSDWDGIELSKEEAKKYVLEYGKGA